MQDDYGHLTSGEIEKVKVFCAFFALSSKLIIG